MTTKNRIRELRQEQHKTLREVAEAVETSNQNISNWERGKSEPKLATWQKLADFFNADIAYLQGISDIRNWREAENQEKSFEALNKNLNTNLFYFLNENSMLGGPSDENLLTDEDKSNFRDSIEMVYQYSVAFTSPKEPNSQVALENSRKMFSAIEAMASTYMRNTNTDQKNTPQENKVIREMNELLNKIIQVSDKNYTNQVEDSVLNANSDKEVYDRFKFLGMSENGIQELIALRHNKKD